MKQLWKILFLWFLLIGGVGTTYAQDSKVTDLPALASPVDADLVYCIGDPAGDAESNKCTIGSILDIHRNDSTAAHAGTAISNTPAGNVAATTVQAAINELDSEKLATGGNATTATALAADGANCSAGEAPRGVDASGAAQNCTDFATQAELDAHINDTSAAHAASAIASTPAGNLAADDVQEALNELDTEKQPIDSDLTILAGASGNGILSGSNRLGADAGSTDAYAACPTAFSTMSPFALTNGMWFILQPNTANTNGATLNTCSEGTAVAIVKYIGGTSQALATNDLRAGGAYILRYKNSPQEWQLLSNPGNTVATVPGSDKYVIFNDGGAFGADAGFIYDKATDTITLLGSIIAAQAVFGDCSSDCITEVTASGVGARTYTRDVAAAGSYVISPTGATKTAGQCLRWDSSGRPVNANSCRRVVEIEVFAPGVANTTGDGKAYFRIPTTLDGMNLVAVTANVFTAGTTNTLNFDLARCATAATGNVCSGTVSDMLTTNGTIDSGENSTSTAAAALAINTSADDVATGQIIRVDIDAVHSTPAQGLLIVMEFELP